MLLKREDKETLGRFACDDGAGRPAPPAAGRAAVLALVVGLAAAVASPAT